MGRKNETSAVIDGLLRCAALGSALGVGLVAPNAIQFLDKPLQTYFNKLDQRARERELMRLRAYLRKSGLVQPYEHGLVITKKGENRLKKTSYDDIAIPHPRMWDKKWRLVLFDIPEHTRRTRNALTTKLRLMGFQPLQQSIWIHPFPCRPEIEAVCMALNVSSHVTVIETSHIDHSHKIIERFDDILKL